MSTTFFGVDIETLPRTLRVNPPLTDAEFEQLCREQDNVQFERSKEGVIHMNPPAGGLTPSGNAEIARQLGNWWHSRPHGRVFDSSAGFFLPDGSMLSPDAAYVTAEKLKGITRGFQGFLRLCPDFVIELLSKSDSLAEAKNKMTLWMENGVTLGWLVNPYTKTVYLYPPDKRDIGFTGKIMHGTYPVEGFDLDLEEVGRCYEF